MPPGRHQYDEDDEQPIDEVGRIVRDLLAPSSIVGERVHEVREPDEEDRSDQCADQ